MKSLIQFYGYTYLSLLQVVDFVNVIYLRFIYLFLYIFFICSLSLTAVPLYLRPRD